MDYFFGGGLKRIRDKGARRWCYKHYAGSVEHEFNILNDIGDHDVQNLNCAEGINAKVAVESALSAGSSFAM